MSKKNDMRILCGNIHAGLNNFDQIHICACVCVCDEENVVRPVVIHADKMTEETTIWICD